MLNTVICCVDYDDFLSLTLPVNMLVLPRPGRITVLTAPWDRRTRSLALEHGADVFATTAWRENGMFNKARALNEWLRHVRTTQNCGWVLMLDADIILPRDLFVEWERLVSDTLYGARRRMCLSESDWLEFSAGRRKMESFPTADLPIIDGRVWGKCPTGNPAALSGYFQLWNCTLESAPKHLVEFPTAAEYDVYFALQFAERQRLFLPGVEVLHLGHPRINWRGRQTERWQPGSA